VLRVAEVERPVPKDDEVLVKVHVSTITRGDAMGVRSVEYRFTRVFTGIRRPRRTVAGTEFAGVVEEVGVAVTEFRVGDEVFGIGGRRGRQALVPPLPALAETPRDLHLGRPRIHVPRAVPRSHHTVRREQACEARHRPLPQRGPPPRQGARRRGQVPGL